MGSKATLLLLSLFTVVLLISFEAAARDLAKSSAEQKNAEVAKEENGLDDAKYPGPGYGGYPGGGHNGGYPGHGGYGRGNPGHGGYGGGNPGHGGYGGGYPRRGGYCRYGCCGGGSYGGGCRRCCSYAGEAVDAGTEAKPHN